MEILLIIIGIMLLSCILLVVLLVTWGINLYNTLIKLENQVSNSFSTIDVELKKRYDLIPNLISTVKAFMTHEKDLLSKVTELRSKAMSPELSPEDKLVTEGQISGTLSKIMVAVEQYPELKSQENFKDLQDTINRKEERLSAVRRVYNSSVTQFNNSIEVFPNVILANAMNFQEKSWFETEESEKENINVGSYFN